MKHPQSYLILGAMSSWLAYLHSRSILPQVESDLYILKLKLKRLRGYSMPKLIKYHSLLCFIVFVLLTKNAAIASTWVSEPPVIPKVELIDQDNHSVRLDELIHEHIVLVNFMFTSCTSSCSPQTAILRATMDAVNVPMSKTKYSSFRSQLIH